MNSVIPAISELADALDSACEYYESNKHIAEVSVLEMMMILESIFYQRKAQIQCLESSSKGYYFTVTRENGSFIVISSPNHKWTSGSYQEQLLLQVRLCVLDKPDYRLVNEENLRSHDLKFVISYEEGQYYLEARRFIDLYGGIKANNLCNLIDRFIASAQVLCVAFQEERKAAKQRAVESVPPAPSRPQKVH
ncbi:hypothetical protein [Pseudoalteromonas rubra]|uniref:YbjN domain-containing protein n=1 Tax=Pseudoalteromonas rubra TaxID=43658 RepID=A0A0U3H4G5_9GAMM|nr:hypothetical protein [Pseudoalteromonas rubra]ALU46163.1 hypothetical protein AT705_24685 [Pseudoalteromonas rubra]